MDMQLEMHSGKMVAFDTSHELLYVQSGCSRLSLEELKVKAQNQMERPFREAAQKLSHVAKKLF